MPDVVASGSSVIEDAFSGKASAVYKGDFLYDANGREYKVTKVRVLKNGQISIKLGDYPPNHYDADKELTIRRGTPKALKELLKY
jgi:hypothetical protein